MNRIPASEHPDVICHCTFADGWAYPDPNHPCPAVEPEQVWRIGPSPELVEASADYLKVKRGGITYPSPRVEVTGSDTPKMIVETLCVAQSAIAAVDFYVDRRAEHIDRLQRLIDSHEPRAENPVYAEPYNQMCEDTEE